MKIYFLGCGGWIPDKDETSCFMVECKNKLILLDAGTGISNLKNHLDVLHKYDTITILLTHYHLDHIIGLIYLLPYIKEKKLHIYGPGKPIYKKTTQQILEELLNPVFFSRQLHKFCDEVYCYDYAGKDFKIEDISIGVKQQKHAAPSFRLTVDNKLIYATDTTFDELEWTDNYKGMTLLHECWDITNDNVKHTSLENLLKGLPSYLLDSTYLIHKNSQWTDTDYSKINKMISGTGVKLAEDGQIITL